MDQEVSFQAVAAELRGVFHAYEESPSGAEENALSEERFDRLARFLFAAQCAASPVYARHCRSLGRTPQTVKNWREIPAVSTAALREIDFSPISPARRTKVFRSSGTAGSRRSVQAHHPDSLALYEASLWPPFRKRVLTGLEPGGRWAAVSLTPPPEQAPESSLVHMIAAAIRRARPERSGFFATAEADGGWRLEAEKLLAELKTLCAEGRPACVLGTAFSFAHLLDEAQRRGVKLRLPEGSRAMETGGYKGRSRELPKTELYARLGDALGLPASCVVSEYGMCELSSQAYDAAARAEGQPVPLERRAFRFPPWARVRIIAPESGREAAPGEIGLLEVIDLANVWALAAVQTEDLAIPVGDGGFHFAGRAPKAEPRGCSFLPKETAP